MKRIWTVLTAILFTFFASGGISQAVGFSLKITGGYGTMATGDYNTFGQDWERLINLTADSSGATASGEFKKLNFGLEYEAEFILNLFGGFGIGVGVGYIQRSNESELGLTDPLAGSLTITISPYFTATPINVSAYYFSPGVVPLKLFVYGGGGYYLARLKTTFRIEAEPPDIWGENEFELKDRGFGFHVGGGLEFKFIPKVSFFVEGRYRYCKLESWEGDETARNSDGFTEQDSGKLWYYEYQDFGGEWFSSIGISESQPDNPTIRNVRPFQADLSGFVLRVGVRIKF